MPVTDPPYHAGGKRFTGRAGQSLAGELGDDLVVIASLRHGPDFSNECIGIADRLGVVRPPPNLDCFRRSTLPADLQVQQLWLLWVLDDGNIADQQTDDVLAVASRGGWRLPQSREVSAELQNLLFLFGCDTAHRLAFKMRQLGFQFKHPLHSVVPALLECTGNEPVAGVGLLITALCQISFVAGTLDPSVPLRGD